MGHIHVHRTRFKLQHGEVWLGRNGKEHIAEGGLAALLWIYKNRLDIHQEWFGSSWSCFEIQQRSSSFFHL